MAEVYNDDFLEQYAGQGTENLAGGTPFLNICNKLTEEGMKSGKMLGHWWHSGLNKSFGDTINVVPTGWKDVWVEKSDEGRTVAYHEKDGIKIRETGSGADYKCINPTTGNKVERTICVVCTIPNEEESPCVLIFNVKSMEAARMWRKMLNFNRLSSGAKAPIFSHVWKLTTEKRVNGKNTFYVLGKVEKGVQVTKEYLLADVMPLVQLQMGNPLSLLPAPAKVQEETDEVGTEVFE